jgi:hypothetical protein
MYDLRVHGFACPLRLIVLAGLLSGAACDKRMLPGTPGAGGDGAVSGGAASGGMSGGDPGSAGMSGSGGAVGQGGMSGAGGAPITSCPASEPTASIACTGLFNCRFTTFCTCHGCCSSGWRCMDGIFQSIGLDYNDGCIQGSPCPDGGPPTGGAGTGGSGTGGRGGTGGVVGGGGTGSVAPISSCPASEPRAGVPCDGTFTCDYQTQCRCGACCYVSYRCASGSLAVIGSNAGCMLVCDAGIDGMTAPPVCTFGADQTCNDNPAVSSIHGHCVDAGVCTCSEGARNPDSGRCL